MTAIFIVALLSITVTQTDWSGGPGYPGPVTDWSNTYFSSSQVSIDPGNLKLGIEVLNVAEYYPITETIFTRDDWTVVQVVDFDFDGDCDVVSSSGLGIIWYENMDGSGTSWLPHEVDDSFGYSISFSTADIDGDGDKDFVGASISGNELAWWKNIDGSGTNWSKETIQSDFIYANSIHGIDMNNDGNLDILASGESGIFWWENISGTGDLWIIHDLDISNHCGVTPVDMDYDGDIDVVGGYCWQTFWMENLNGAATQWTTHYVETWEDLPHFCKAADFDSDNDMDLISTGTQFYELRIQMNPGGTGEWEEFTILGGILVYHITDFDHDGDTDIIATTTRIYILLNTGDGISWNTHQILGYSSFMGEITGDFDNNGIPDIAAHGESSSLGWIKVSEYVSTGFLESTILDTGSAQTWHWFEATYEQPSSSTIGFQFRSSNDLFNMGNWSEIVYSSTVSLSGILTDSTRYLQYRVLMETEDSDHSPLLEDVEFTYFMYNGINPDDLAISLTPVSNPSNSNQRVLLHCLENCSIEIVLYDSSGRAVSNIVRAFTAGSHTITFRDLTSGIYYCMANSGEFHTSVKLVVLD